MTTKLSEETVLLLEKALHTDASMSQVDQAVCAWLMDCGHTPSAASKIIVDDEKRREAIETIFGSDFS